MSLRAGRFRRIALCSAFPENYSETLSHGPDDVRRKAEHGRQLVRGELRIMFIGLLTEEVMSSTKNERVIGTYINVEEAAKEVGVISDNYRTKDTDILVLLTHIGIEKDRQLASRIRKEFIENKRVYGYRKMQRSLEKQGISWSRNAGKK